MFLFVVNTVVSFLPDSMVISVSVSLSLHITTIRAGITGLSAAIGLRRTGQKSHGMTIFTENIIAFTSLNHTQNFERPSFGHEIVPLLYSRFDKTGIPVIHIGIRPTYRNYVLGIHSL